MLFEVVVRKAIVVNAVFWVPHAGEHARPTRTRFCLSQMPARAAKNAMGAQGVKVRRICFFQSIHSTAIDAKNQDFICFLGVKIRQARKGEKKYR